MTTENGSALGVAIVGCGQIVTHHIAAMSAMLDGKVIVRALCDPSFERRMVIDHLLHDQYVHLLPKKELHHQLDSLDQLITQEPKLLEEKIDIIFIAVPHDLHESITMQALALNKIVVLEKPLAPTQDAIERLIQVSQHIVEKKKHLKSYKSMLIVAEQSPYWQEVELAKKKIEDGVIGNIVTAASYYYESMRDNITSGDVDSTTGGLGWRGSLARAGGGIAIDGGLHWIRPLREMLGRRIERVIGTIRCNLEPSLQMEGESVGHALFQMGAPETEGTMPTLEPEGTGPLTATFSCNMLATAPMAHNACPYFRITGTKGELIIHGTGLLQQPGAGGLRLYNDKYPEGMEMFPEDRQGGFYLGFHGLWKEIHRICSTNDYDAAHESVVKAGDDVKVVLALYKSTKSQTWERV